MDSRLGLCNIIGARFRIDQGLIFYSLPGASDGDFVIPFGSFEFFFGNIAVFVEFLAPLYFRLCVSQNHLGFLDLKFRELTLFRPRSVNKPL